MNTRVFFRKFNTVFYITAIAISFSTVIFVTSRNFFRIRTIEVVGSNVSLDIDYTRMGTNLYLFPVEKVRQQILTHNTHIKDVSLKKRYPSTLIIEVITRSPISVLASGNDRYLLDKDGYILSIDTGNNNLPVTAINCGSINIGDSISDARVKQALQFISLISKDIAIKLIEEAGNSSLRAEAEKFSIFFPQSGDIVAKVESLQTLVSGFKIKGTLPKSIDLRYTKPFVKY